MKRCLVLGCLVFASLTVVPAAVRGQINDSYFQQQLEKAQQQQKQNAGYVIVKRPWGGPTTPTSWWTSERVRVGSTHHGWHGIPSAGSSVNFNYYYFAPFSYPIIQNNYGFRYGFGY